MVDGFGIPFLNRKEGHFQGRKKEKRDCLACLPFLMLDMPGYFVCDSGMNKKNMRSIRLGITLAALLLSAFDCSAAGGSKIDVDWAFNFDLPSVGLSDGADSSYTGDMGSGWGTGGMIAILGKVGDGVSIGPNFNFFHNDITGNYYNFLIFLPSFGPMVKFNRDRWSLYADLNYQMGWANMYQELSSCSSGVCPAGDFTADVRGWAVDARAAYTISKIFSFGPYISYGRMAFLDFKYNYREFGSYIAKFADIDLNYAHFGLSLYW